MKSSVIYLKTKQNMAAFLGPETTVQNRKAATS